MGKGRTPCCEKGRVKKGPWSQDEDLKLISFIQRHGHSNWRSLPKLAGLARCGKSCRLRWVNYLRPDVKRGSLSPDEEETIIRLQSLLGNKWSKIASHLPGRTDNEIKNIWNTHLKKRSTDNKSHHFHGQGIAPPISSSDCTALESNNYNYHDVVAQTISYDEPSLVDLWDSLLLDDDRLNNPNISGGKQSPTAMIQGECSAINNDYGGSIRGVVDDQRMSKANHQLEAVSNEDNNMESYLEIMAWPSSPTCYSFSGF